MRYIKELRAGAFGCAGREQNAAAVLQNRLSSLNIDVQIFDVDSTIFLTNMLSGIRTNDAFFMLSFPRLDNSRMPFLAEQLVKHNIPIVCIAENPASAVARHATVTLICQADTPIYYNSYSAPMVMANALVSLMAGQMKDDVQAFQTQIENLRSEYTAYSKCMTGMNPPPRMMQTRRRLSLWRNGPSASAAARARLRPLPRVPLLRQMMKARRTEPITKK